MRRGQSWSRSKSGSSHSFYPRYESDSSFSCPSIMVVVIPAAISFYTLFILYTVFLYSPTSISSEPLPSADIAQVQVLNNSQHLHRRVVEASPPATFKGFYLTTPFVTEVKSPQHFKTLTTSKSSKQPIITVFYADWCGHCKKFAPSYINYAALTNQRIAALNQLIKYQSSRYTNITFLAVNCPRSTVESLCDKDFKISAYPTIIAMNFPKVINDTKITKNYGNNENQERFIGTIDNLEKFLKKTMFQVKSGRFTADLPRTVPHMFTWI